MRTALYAIIALLLITSVAATNSYFIDDHVNLTQGSSYLTEYCVTEDDEPLAIDTQVSKSCYDLNGKPGCQTFDKSSAGVLVTVDKNTGSDGCSDVLITATEGATEGKYYYFIDGQMGEATITGETLLVNVAAVPEFGMIAAAGVLVAVGMVIKRKRG